MITKEMFLEWKAHPVTIEVYEEVEKLISMLKDQLAEGTTLLQQADATHGATSRLVGQIEGLNQLLKLDYEDELKGE